MNKDLTKGPIFKTLFVYSIPLILSSTLQCLFNASNITVLSLLSDEISVAAVGACASLITLLTGIFMGFVTGANVLVARRIGAGDESGVRRAIGSALALGLVTGTILMMIVQIFAKQFLILMNCPSDVLGAATVYLRIYFLGMPIIMLYNFIFAILRAAGDSVRPMIYMLISGVLNIGSNAFFAGVLDLAVEGAALSTVLSQLVLLILSLIALIRSRGICKIELRHLRIRRQEFGEMFRIGTPPGISSLLFYFSDVALSSSVNSMGTNAVTAFTIATKFDGTIYTIGYTIALAAMAVIGQNFGAGKPDRIRKTIGSGVLYATVATLFFGTLFVIFANPLLHTMSDNSAVIEIAKERMTLMCLTYFTTSIMEVLHFAMPVLKRQSSTLVIGVICGFGMRSLWAWFIWPFHKTISFLFLCFPISAIVATIVYIFVYRNAMKAFEVEFADTRHFTEQI